MDKETDLLDDQLKQRASMKSFDFPIEFEFKITSLANDFTARDANGAKIAYVRQKMFKFMKS